MFVDTCDTESPSQVLLCDVALLVFIKHIKGHTNILFAQKLLSIVSRCQEFVEIEIAREDAQGKIPLSDMMVIIAHELVHAKQISEGRLINHGFVEKEENLLYCWEWEGREFSAIAYEDQPWEIEAYALEKEIYEACR